MFVGTLGRRINELFISPTCLECRIIDTSHSSDVPFVRQPFFYRVPEGEESTTSLLFSKFSPLHFPPTPPTRKCSEVHVRPEICFRFWDMDGVGKLLAISPFTRFFVGGEGGPLRVLKKKYGGEKEI